MTPIEEAMVCQHYLKKLFEFCGSFKPPVPRNALVCEWNVEQENLVLAFVVFPFVKNVCAVVCFLQGTAAAYFKRFYLHTSIMEHHPKDILYVISVFLLCFALKTLPFSSLCKPFHRYLAKPK